MTGTRSKPGAGFALGRMGFVIGSPRGSLYPSRYTPISAIEVSFCHWESLLPPLPSDALHMRGVVLSCSLGIFSFTVTCLPSTAVMCRDESHVAERKPRASEESPAERDIKNRRISTIRNQRSTLTREYHAGIFSIRSVFGADFACVEEPAGRLTDAAA